MFVGLQACFQEAYRGAKQMATRWILPLLFLCVQVHACSAEYVFRDGGVCVECPTLVDQDSNVESHPEPEIDEQHGDCHDCCTLQECNQSDSKEVVASISPLMDLPDALLSSPELSIPVLDSPASAVPIWIEGCPSTGPPTPHASRAPPFFLA